MPFQVALPRKTRKEVSLHLENGEFCTFRCFNAAKVRVCFELKHDKGDGESVDQQQRQSIT